MSDRTVSVRLQLELAGYIAGTRQAAVATRGLATEVAKMSAANKQASQDVSRAAALGGAALLAGVGLATKAFASFDKAMSGVRAATHETSANMKLLRNAAIEAGARTAFSATEAAEGMTELSKAGIGVQDVLGGGLRGALDLAAAGQIGVAEAAETAASAMTQFGLAGSDVPHIADLLAAGAGRAQGSVSEMGLALSYVGPIAGQMGVSIEETAGSIALLASNGILGEKAGTNLRGVLAALTSPSAKAAETMKAFGISVYDAQGQFVGFSGVAQQLQQALSGVDEATRNQALGQIFGNETLVGALTLYKGGAAAVDEWTSKVNDQGYATETAAIQLDNLAGDLEKFTGSIETAFIKSGSGANGAMRELTQGATEAVNAFSDLPGPVQGAATGVAALSGATLLAVGAFGTMAPKVRETRSSLESMGRAGVAANRGISALGKASAVAGGILLVASAVDQLGDHLREVTGNGAPSVDRLTNSLVSFAQTGKVGGEAARVLGDGLGDLGYQVKILTGDGTLGAIRGFEKGMRITALGMADNVSEFVKAEEAMDGIDAALSGLVNSGSPDVAAALFDALAARVAASGQSVDEFRSLLDGYGDALASADTEQKLAAVSANGLGSSLDTVAPAAEDAKASLEAYTGALTDMTNIDAYTSTAELTKSFRELKKELKDGGKVTNDEKITLGGFARQVRQTANAVLEQTGSQAKANESMRGGKARFIELAEAAGYSAGKARKLADNLLDIPARTDVHINETGADAALSKILELRRQAGVPIAVTVNTINRLNTIPGGPRVRRAEGGLVTRDEYALASGGIVRGPSAGGPVAIISLAQAVYAA